MLPPVFTKYSPEAASALELSRHLVARDAPWIFAGPGDPSPDARENWGTLLRAGPESFERLHVPRPLLGNRWSDDTLLRLTVPPELRTADTNRLAYAAAASLWLGGLQLCEVTENAAVKQTLGLIPGHLLNVAGETKDLLLEGGSLPQLLVESLRNEFWGNRRSIHVVRLLINMTTANQVDDHMGAVGTLFQKEALAWLKERFGSTHVFSDPARTAFVFKVSGFEEARGHLRDFDREVAKRILRKLHDPHQNFRRISWRKLTQFRPQHFAFGSVLTLEDQNNDPESKKEAIGKIREFLRTLAAKTSFLERHKPEFERNNYLFVEKDLPTDLSPLHADLERALRTSQGYVPVGVYGQEPRPGQSAEEVEQPALRRLAGHVDRDIHLNGGGVLQRLTFALGALLALPTPGQIEDLLKLIHADPLKTTVTRGLGLSLDGTLCDLVRIGLIARCSAAYPMLIRPIETRLNTEGNVENANFFIEEMAHRGFRHIAVCENDNAKARRNHYPPPDHVDAEFQLVRKIWFDVAKELNMTDEMGAPRVIISPFQGDQILVSFDPGNVAPQTYLKKVQERIRSAFAHQPFQLEAKVTRTHLDADGLPREEVERLPLWKRTDSETDYIASRLPLPGYEPVGGYQTATVTYADLERPLISAEQGEAVMELFGLMGRYIEDSLKKRRMIQLPDGTSCSIEKEGFGLFPDESIPLPLKGGEAVPHPIGPDADTNRIVMAKSTGGDTTRKIRE